MITLPHRPLSDVYRMKLGPLVDGYELTMAYAFWKKYIKGKKFKNGDWRTKRATFQYYFRKLPFGGGYAVFNGLTHLLDYIRNYGWESSQLEMVANLTGNDGKPLFPESEFIDFLGKLRLRVDVKAMRNGDVMFANIPGAVITGDIIEGFLLESAVLNQFNFNTLCTTKAARIIHAAKGRPCSDQSLRRDQGIDGSLTAAWASYVGGFGSTSNMLASALFGIPNKGTMAHAFIMSFVDELEAFLTFAWALPNNCVFLVDTYNSIEGVKKAIEVAKKLRARGHKVLGIRLDSGDLTYLSKAARELLDGAGFPEAKVFISNDLDEYIIENLLNQGAQIDVLGVGTKVGTCYDQPALGGVYKLAAIEDEEAAAVVARASEQVRRDYFMSEDAWRYTVKVSETAEKCFFGAFQETWRFIDRAGKMRGDMIVNALNLPKANARKFSMVDPFKDSTRVREYDAREFSHERLLVDVVNNGEVVYDCPNIHQDRAFREQRLAMLDDSHKRLMFPHEYPVAFERGFYQVRRRAIAAARKGNRKAAA